MNEREPRFNPSPEKPEQPTPEAVMPDDIVEPEGKSGGWGPVVENKGLGVRYREKVIELPKHRQEETGIKRIRRREILEMPSEMKVEENGKIVGYNIAQEDCIPAVNFFTDGIFPQDGNLVHTLNWGADLEIYQSPALIEEHKKSALYFQDFFPQPYTDYSLYKLENNELEITDRFEDKGGGIFGMDEIVTEQQRKEMISISYLYFADVDIANRSLHNMYIGSNKGNPVYVFGRKNAEFRKYIETLLNNPLAKKVISKDNFATDQMPIATEFLEGSSKKHGEWALPIVRAPGMPKFRWCNADLAIIPTKRSLNVLFFETDDVDSGSGSK